MGYTGHSITLDGASFPLVPPMTTPFSGQTGGIPGRDKWDYANPFAQKASVGRGGGSGSTPKVVPWGASITSTSSPSVVSRLTSHSLSRAMTTNNVTPGKRTQYTLAYWRAQNPHLDYYNMYEGYIVGFLTFLFGATEKIPSPFGIFDAGADILARLAEPSGLDSDGYGTFYREKPYAEFANNMTLPQLNFILSCISLDPSIMSDTDFEATKAFHLTREDILDAFAFDGLIYNQEGGDLTYHGGDRERDRGVLYNIVQDGVHTSTRNCWGNDILGGTKLWLICKKVKVGHTTYRLNPNDKSLRKPGLPKEILKGLGRSFRNIYTTHINNPNRLVWQITPWYHLVRDRPNMRDISYEEKIGETSVSKKYGFALYVGRNRYRPPSITEDTIKRAKTDAYSYINAPQLEVILSGRAVRNIVM